MINKTDNLGRTALMLSISSRNYEIADFLVTYEVGKQTSLGLTALMCATVIDAPIQLVSTLAAVESGRQTSEGVTALMLAALHGRNHIFQLLKNEIKMKDSRGRPALVYAFLGGNLIAIQTLIQEQSNCSDYQGNNMIFYAARSLKIESWKAVLLFKGIKVENNSQNLEQMVQKKDYAEINENNTLKRNSSDTVSGNTSLISDKLIQVAFRRAFEAFCAFGEMYNDQMTALDSQNFESIMCDFIDILCAGPHEIIILLQHQLFKCHPYLRETLQNQINQLQSKAHVFSGKKQSILHLFILNNMYNLYSCFKVLSDQLDIKQRGILHYLAYTVPNPDEKEQYFDLVRLHIQRQHQNRDNLGNTPVHTACESQNYDFLELWIQNIKITQTDLSKSAIRESFQQKYLNNDQQTPLHVLCSQKLHFSDERDKNVIIFLINLFGDIIDTNLKHFLNLVASNGLLKAFGGPEGFLSLFNEQNCQQQTKSIKQLLSSAKNPPSVSAAENDNPEEFLFFCVQEGEASRRAIYSVLRYNAVQTLKYVMDVVRGVINGPKDLCCHMMSQRYRGHDLLYWAIASEAWHCVRLLCFWDTGRYRQQYESESAENASGYPDVPTIAIPDADFTLKNGLTPLIQAAQIESIDARTLSVLAQFYAGKVLRAPFLGLPKGSCALMVLLAVGKRDNLYDKIVALISEKSVRNAKNERAYDVALKIGAPGDVLEILG